MPELGAERGDELFPVGHRLALRHGERRPAAGRRWQLDAPAPNASHTGSLAWVSRFSPVAGLHAELTTGRERR
jgi:hypothetical protein